MKGFRVARPELGTKRQCGSCAAKFYDLHRSPIVCPKCGTIYQAMQARVGLSSSLIDTEDDDAADPLETSLISLDDLETEEDAKNIPLDSDIDLSDGDEDDTFLVDDESGDDDVVGLLDGDVVSDDDI
jgi:uncharacterized protein (TIGR02300 family)